MWGQVLTSASELEERPGHRQDVLQPSIAQGAFGGVSVTVGGNLRLPKVTDELFYRELGQLVSAAIFGNEVQDMLSGGAVAIERWERRPADMLMVGEEFPPQVVQGNRTMPKGGRTKNTKVSIDLFSSGESFCLID